MAKQVNNKQGEAGQIECDYVTHTPCHFTHDGKEYNLITGIGYSLPNCQFVQSLIDQGRLIIKK